MREFNACECTEIKIGRTSENDAEVVRFNVSGWPDLYGSGGAFVLVHRRPNEEQPYVCAASVAEDGWLEWVIQAADVEITGKGEAQLTYVINNTSESGLISTGNALLKYLRYAVRLLPIQMPLRLYLSFLKLMPGRSPKESASLLIPLLT